MFSTTNKSISSKRFGSKFLAVAAGLMLASPAAFAQLAPINPLDNPAPAPVRQEQPADDGFTTRLVGEIDGVPVVVILQVTQRSANGVMMIGNLRCPVQATMNRNVIEGTWTGQTGRASNLSITLNADGAMTLRTNGREVALKTLANAAQNDGPALRPEPAPRPAPIQPRPVNNDFNQPQPVPANDRPAPNTNEIRPFNGRFFTMPVPAGWRQFEERGNAMVVSPDGKGGYGVVGRPTRANTGAELVKELFASWNVRDLTFAAEQTTPRARRHRNL